MVVVVVGSMLALFGANNGDLAVADRLAAVDGA